MANGVNKVILVGNLGADPELRTTAGGHAVMSLRLATSKKWRDKKSGNLEEHTEWHRVSVWGKSGEALFKLLRKGDKIYLEGELRTSSYEKEGVTHYSTEVTAREIVLCGSPPAGGRRPDPPPRDPPRGSGADTGGYGPPAGDDDDIPF